MSARQTLARRLLEAQRHREWGLNALLREAAEALESVPPEARRSPEDIIGNIVADICSRKGLSHEWESIDDEIRDEIVAEWLTFFAEPDNAMGEQLVYSLNEAQSEQFLKAMQEHREPTPTMIAGRKRLKELSAPSATVTTPRRWRDTKVTVPCDGDNVLGYWASNQSGPGFDCDVVHYYGGHWHEPSDDEDDFRAPDFWMPLPEMPNGA